MKMLSFRHPRIRTIPLRANTRKHKKDCTVNLSLSDQASSDAFYGVIFPISCIFLLSNTSQQSAQYLWSVRARLIIDGDLRVTERGMAGIPLRNEAVPNFSCFRFETPETRP